MTTILALAPWYSLVFMVVMIMAFVYLNLFAFDEKCVTYGPAIFTTAGILGTFLGISIGLLHFDSGHVQTSLPSLLTGMRTAFWVSLLGVGSSLFIKIRHAFYGIPEKFRKEDDGDPVEELIKHSVMLHRLVGGQDGISLSSHLDSLRKENREQFGSLQKSLDHYVEKMADVNSRVLLESLEKVMNQFNVQINALAGDSFRELAGSIKNMVEWQNTYRETMPQIVRQLEEMTSRHLEFTENTRQFGEIFARVGELVKSLNDQRSRLEASMTMLGKLFESAQTALPGMEKKILELSGQMETGVRAVTEQTVQSIADARKALLSSVEETNAEINAQIAGLVKKTQEQVLTLDVALEKELTHSIESLGRQLAGLSHRFVADYGPLADRLRAVVEIAERTQKHVS